MLRALLLALCVTAPAAGQPDLVITAAGATDGTYYARIVVAQGVARCELIPATSVYALGGRPKPPSPPEPPDNGSALARVAFDAVVLVTEDPDRDYNAQRQALMYAELAEHIGADFAPFVGPAPWQHLSQATRDVRARLIGPAAEEAWNPWRKAVSAEMARMESAGELKTADQMRKAYQDLAAGLERTGGGEARRKLSPEMRDLILQVIRLILEALLK